MGLKYCAFLFFLAASTARGLDFAEVPLVSAGDPITSSNWNAMATAFSERITSGLGDCAWRIFYKAFTLTRSLITNEPADYWLNVGMHIPYGASGLEANLETPLGQFVFGDDADVVPENERLSSVVPAASGLSALQYWYLGHTQRLHATEAARSHWSIISNAWSQPSLGWLTTFGGLLPSVGPTNRMSLLGTNTSVSLNATSVVSTGADRYTVDDTNDYIFSEWLYGPHDGAASVQLGFKPSGDQSPQAPGKQLWETLQWYLSEYRGATNQRSPPRLVGFNWQRFFTNQYRLAAPYSNAPARVEWDTDNTTNDINSHSGYAFFGFNLSNATAASTPPSVTLKHGSNTLWSGHVPGLTNIIVWHWSRPATEISIITTNNTENDKMILELAEIEVRTPDMDDAYLVLRKLAGDTPGHAFISPRTLEAGYWANALIGTNSIEEPLDLWQNPVHEAARRFLRDNLRLITQWSDDAHATPSLIEYSTNASGQSVLKFNRYYTTSGTNTLDLWEGIAPASTNSTNGIVATAPAKGVDNRWVMFISSACYNDYVLDPDLLNQRAMLHNRAHAFHDGLSIDSGLRSLFDPTYRAGASLLTEPIQVAESPSGFSYARGLNWSAGTNFFASNPMFKPPYQIASTALESNGTVVVVTLNSRLDYPDGTNDYRTDENLVTDFLAYQNTGTNCPRRTGDVGIPTHSSTPSPLYGSCLPRFYFVRLPPRVHEDTNNVVNNVDTVALASQMQQLVFYLSAMCEGFTDTQSVFTNCQVASSYTFETLCYRAFNGRWIDLLTPTAVGERKQSFGPLPRQTMYAEQWNKLASAVNLLTDVHLEVPLGLQTKTIDYWGRTNLTLDVDLDYSASGTNCPAITNLDTTVAGYHAIHNLDGATYLALASIPISTNDWHEAGGEGLISYLGSAGWTDTNGYFRISGFEHYDVGGGTYAYRGPNGEQVMSVRRERWVRPTPTNFWLNMLHESLRPLTNSMVAFVRGISTNVWYTLDEAGSYLTYWTTNCGADATRWVEHSEIKSECIVLQATNHGGSAAFLLPCPQTSNSVMAASGSSGVFYQVEPHRSYTVIGDAAVIGLRVPLRSPP